ncbi:ATP-binding cassette domain-containing protein [Fulvivirga kasyanovii]|uniref:ATP-binding cassette domain-containing protein n=1 Tax=Fulvivirga kasyanovii TaxID=396812 RepID=A0ABW9RLM0_9BACT|nr:ATP-binding cassette domain-containing protein [Fulvivirga kasyanovii]MTI24913.1 ATP-binding cassette domain-containing protein [Fulvivirga kasyanovii]
MSVISLRDIEVRFNSKHVFDGFSLDIGQGEKVRIKGKSGAGKTTLFKLMLGFLQPDAGEVLYEGQKLNGSTVWRARKSMAYVSQDMSIGEGLVKDFFDEIFSYEANKHLQVDREDIMKLFRKFSLNEELYEGRIPELSGGEKQRIAIVISILLDRPVYLLDEITSSLDEVLKEKIAQYFLGLKGKTLLIISHDRVWEKNDVKLIDLDNLR